MALSTTAERIVVWGPLTIVLLLVTPFVAAYLEFLLTGTSYVEDVFRWLGIHDAILRLLESLFL